MPEGDPIDQGDDSNLSWPPALTEEQIVRVALALFDAGRERLPIRLEGQPLPENDPRRELTHIELDPASFVRMWMAGLFHRALDGYHATLALREIELDVDARAHMRIAFEHLCAFAWVAAEPDNIERPLRIGRFGMEFQGRQFEELARFYTLTESQLRELGFATQIEESKLKKPPPARVICEELDRDWGGKLPSMDAGASASFGAWYSHIFRGASAFVHPSPRGIEPLLFRSPGLFVLEPSRARELRILELCAMHLSVAVGIASLSYPELIHDGPLQEIADLAAV